MSALSDATRDFHEDLDRISHVLQLAKTIRSFGASEIPEGGLLDGWEEAKTLYGVAKARRTDLPLIAGSILIYMTGRFEFFFRQTIESTADVLAAAVDRYDDLPEEFRKQLKTRTFDVAQNPQKFNKDGSTADSFVEDLVTLWSGEYDATRVQSLLLSIIETNLHSTALGELARNVGLKSIWKDLGKQAKLKLALETDNDGTATQEARSRLDALMKERNRLAHPTSSLTFPDPDQVESHVKFLRALSDAISDTIAVHQAVSASMGPT